MCWHPRTGSTSSPLLFETDLRFLFYRGFLPLIAIVYFWHCVHVVPSSHKVHTHRTHDSVYSVSVHPFILAEGIWECSVRTLYEIVVITTFYIYMMLSLCLLWLLLQVWFVSLFLKLSHWSRVALSPYPTSDYFHQVDLPSYVCVYLNMLYSPICVLLRLGPHSTGTNPLWHDHSIMIYLSYSWFTYVLSKHTVVNIIFQMM